MNNLVQHAETRRPSRAGFVLQPANVSEAMQMATMLAKSEMVPKSYKNKAEDILVAMMMGCELGLNPIQSLQNIAVINGRPCVWGDAMPALAQNHPAFGGIEESFDDAAMTATCIVWRKGGPKHTQKFGQADAHKAGLWGKTGPWQQYPKRMLQLRARGFALRDQFADALAGLVTREEAEDTPFEIDVTPYASALTARHESLPPPDYSAESFEANFKAWSDAIKSGKRTASQIISMVSTKGALSDEQRKRIMDLEVNHADS